MYPIYCSLLMCLVYTLPALAFFPYLITSARTAFAIPVLSALIIYGVVSLLQWLHLFTTPLVTCSALVLAGGALYRLRNVIITESFDWPKSQWLIYLFHAAILLPYAIKLGTHGFERGDEIYSWNFWALQHYFQLPLDFSHTGAPYPQLFPKLLAFGYHLLGNIELQLPLKATLIVFPWAMLTAIAMSFAKRTKMQVGLYLIAFSYMVGLAGLERFFDDGYADPIMISALITSMALFWRSQHIDYLPPIFTPFRLGFLSVLCAIAAAHAKQPGLLWVLFSLPVLLWTANKEKPLVSYQWLIVLSLGGGLWWVLGEGQQFHHNNGVLDLSLAGRNAIAQLGFAINKYLIQRPFLLLLFIAAYLGSAQHKLLRRSCQFFMLPALLCWFLFGAYQLRLGQHIIAFAFFVVVASGYAFLKPKLEHSFVKRYESFCRAKQQIIVLVCTGFTLSLSTLLFVQWGIWDKPGVSLYAGGRQSLQRYFGTDAPMIYSKIYSDKTALLWVPTRYLYGLFYQHTQLTTPDYGRYPHYDQSALIQELKQKLPDYLFTVSEDIKDGPASGLLKEVIARCPRAFKAIATAENRFSFVTYKLDKKALALDSCLNARTNS